MLTTAPTLADHRARLVADAVISAYVSEIDRPRERPAARPARDRPESAPARRRPAARRGHRCPELVAVA
jgi:hypothetical protein